MSSLRVPLHKIILAIGDYSVILLSIWIAIQLRLPERNLSPESINFFALQSILLICLSFSWIIIFQSQNLYKINWFLSTAQQFVAIFKSVGYGILGIVMLSFIVKGNYVLDSRLITAYLALVLFVLLVVWRIFVFRSLYIYLSRHSIGGRNILIVGAGRRGTKLAREIISLNRYGLNVVGFLDDKIPTDKIILDNRKVLGSIKDLRKVIEEIKIDEIIIAMSNVTHSRLHDIMDFCKSTGIATKLSSALYEIVPTKVDVEFYGNNVVIDLSSGFDRVQGFYKRSVDIFLSLISILIITPFLIIISIAIKLDSRGPIFYRQKRVGKDGKLFWCYKFRSMHIDADERKKELEAFNEVSGPIFKMKNDPRVTRVGKFIRRLSVDEVPQILNVLMGDMSFVGPRPCTPDELQKYEDWHKRRLSVPQGITGLWQVSGRSNLSFVDMVILDLYYVENASVIMDFNIILRTLPAVIFGKGAY
ncbi:MAG: sugar transferase [Chloroherpetonaceae bacterium]|nr:sugar transferase [Chloroherpetonaceae bacterium]